MSKTLQEHATEMTKEQFINMVDEQDYCPNHYGLLQAGDFNLSCQPTNLDICHQCWEKALSEASISFKQPIAVMEQYLPVLQQLQQAELQYKQLDDQRKALKEQLQEVMEANSITKWENDDFSISYVAEGKATTTLDSAKVKKKYPDIYEDCCKPKAGTKAYVKFNLKS